MKGSNIVLMIILLLGFTELKSQENIFLSPDQPAKCEKLKQGKFLRVGYPVETWFMTIKDNVQTEYYNDGKDYIKSRLEFVDDCNYKVIITGKSDESHPIKLGEVLINKILETDHNFIKIRSEYNNDTFEFVFDKIEENN